jgi:hypothetical protein
MEVIYELITKHIDFTMYIIIEDKTWTYCAKTQLGYRSVFIFFGTQFVCGPIKLFLTLLYLLLSKFP